MILAAGRGERMRPLSDLRPKPLLEAGGKPLIVWQIERLVTAGFADIVVNVAHLGAQIEAALGDGARFGAKLCYSREREPLEVAGGIATALPLLGEGVALVVSADVYAEFDYASLRPRVVAMEASAGAPHLHMVMVPNPAYTFGNIALYRTSLFRELPPGKKFKILPLYQDWIGRGWASGEIHTGHWANVGSPDELVRLDRLLEGDAHLRR